jgi:hypothetical protein
MPSGWRRMATSKVAAEGVIGEVVAPYAPQSLSGPLLPMAAWAAARRAMGTR